MNERKHKGMKKVLAIAVVVVAAAACTKSGDVIYDAPQEIGFRPVSGQLTKGGPMNTGNAGTAYDLEVPFGVFAYHKIVDAGTSWSAFYSANESSAPTLYISNVKFVKNDDNTSKGDPSQYWPKTGSLLFAGYSPYEIHTNYTESMADVAKGSVSYTADQDPYLTVESFEQGLYKWDSSTQSLTNNTVDLMWFDADANDQKSANSNNVTVKFSHACAWLDFVISGSDEFTIEKVALTNMATKGKFVSNASLQWTPTTDNLTDIVLYESTDGHKLGTSKDLSMSNLLIIPQTISKTDASQLVITYKQNTVASGSTALSETIKLNLTAGTDNSSWLIGKHYTYTVSFSLTEILISPSVSNDWTAVTGGTN